MQIGNIKTSDLSKTILIGLVSLLSFSGLGFAQVSLLTQQDGAVTDDRLGTAVAGVGDVNGDGTPDYIAGAPYADPGGISYAGAAIVYSGASGAILFEKNGSTANESFGSYVSGAGDVNGDGKDDFIVSGAIYAIVYSGANGATLYQKTGGGPVGSAGDVDADGRDDFLVSNTGQTTVFSGRTGAVLHQKPQGTAVAGIGDVNSDGKADFLLTDQLAYGSSRGAAYVYSGANGSVIHEIPGPAQNMLFGSSAGAAGDVNGDGVGDFIVGARLGDIGGLNSGAAYVYSGSSGALLYTKTSSAGDQFGRSVGGAGDVNGDGRADFLAGSTSASPGGITQAGIVQLYSGADGSLIERFEGDESYEFFGNSVGAVGDINNNGGSEFIIGAPNASPSSGLYAGSAFIYGSGSVVDPCANDNVAPTLTCNTDKQVSCGAAIIFDAPTASDNCDPSPSVTIVSTTETPGPGANEVTHTRTWQATDASGNVSATCSQNIVEACDPCDSDNTSPTLTCSADKQVSCGEAIVFDAPSASDNCDPSPTVSIVSTVENPGPGSNEVTHTRTWQASDASGNVSATCSQNIVEVCDQSPEPPRSQLTTIRSTCDEFVNNAANDLNEVCYSTRKDKISKSTPGSFIYYVSFTAPKAHFVVDIVQTRDGAFFPFFDVFSDGITVLDACASVGTGVSNSPGQAEIVFSGAKAGKQYVIAVEYNAATLNGIYVDPSTSVQHHDFSAWIDGSEITRDFDGLTVLGCGPKNSRKGPNKVSSMNYPNPFNPSTEISFYIEQDADVSVEIYNMLGQRIITLVDEFAVGGEHTVTWNGTTETGAPVATGVYFLKVTALDEVSVTKMNLLK